MTDDQGQEGTFELAPGHQLRRATDKEISAIRDVLTAQSDPRFTAWEDDKPTKQGSKLNYPPLPKQQWRYFVIDLKEAGPSVLDLEKTLAIAPVEIKIGFTLLHELVPGKKLPVLIYHPGRLATQVRAVVANELPFVEMTSPVLTSVRHFHEQFLARDQSVVNTERHLQQILELDALPFESPLLFLGYFAILESLLTHKPKETDTIDSITRQVKQKLMLLDNRWQPRIDYSGFKGKPDAIWQKMYHYRSDIAHGTEPDFKNSLQGLVDSKRALALVKQTVKSVLRQTVIEPQLMLDLRNC